MTARFLLHDAGNLMPCGVNLFMHMCLLRAASCMVQESGPLPDACQPAGAPLQPWRFQKPMGLCDLEAGAPLGAPIDRGAPSATAACWQGLWFVLISIVSRSICERSQAGGWGMPQGVTDDSELDCETAHLRVSREAAVRLHCVEA